MLGYMKQVLIEILKDVDPDIRDFLLSQDGNKHPMWTYLDDAPMTALLWQLVRQGKPVIYETRGESIDPGLLEPGEVRRISDNDKPQ